MMTKAGSSNAFLQAGLEFSVAMIRQLKTVNKISGSSSNRMIADGGKDDAIPRSGEGRWINL